MIYFNRKVGEIYMTKEEIIQLIELKNEELNKISNEIDRLKEELKKLENTGINRLSTEEKLDIYMSYFRGRDDVFPYLSIDKNDPNKKYYIPACINEWKKGICNKTIGKPCKNCQYRENKPLSIDIIKSHILNNKTVGIYPMLEDESCYFLAFDFDDKKNEYNIKDDVLAFWNVCEKYNINISVEKSRSGYGFHVWIFFAKKIKAITARKLGSLLLSKTMEIRDNLKIESFDRMFPNQDYMPKGGFGNLIVLPFQTEPAKYGNTLFVDKYFLPYREQFEYLKNVHKLTEDEVFDKIKELSENTIDVSHQDLDLKREVRDKRKNNFKFPKEIKVVLADMIYIDKADLNAGVKNSFRRLASFANPEFYKKQRMRMSVYNIPMVIDCSKEDDKYIKIPRGTFEYLKDLCDDQKVKILIDDKRNKGQKLNIKFQGELREEQKFALNQLMKYENGILHAPTGFGKTIVAAKLITERKVNTLIIVNKIELLRQWQKRLKEFTNIDEVGQIGGGKTNITNKIDVASIKTLWNDGKINDVVKSYGLIIVDECHHLAAYTYEGATNNINSKYFYGFTATPDRENGHTPIIKMQCGDIRYEVDFKKFNRNLKLRMKVYVKHNWLNFVNKDIKDYTINEINDMIVKDIIRNEKILKDIKKEFKNNKNILILTERIEHLDYFKTKLNKITCNLFVYHGGIGKKLLKLYEEQKENIVNNNENKIILATGSYIGEGFDDASLDVLFLTMPISGITRVTQYTGRLHRKNNDKKEIIVYDYVDDNFKQTRNMFEKRKKTYEKLGYEIVE